VWRFKGDCVTVRVGAVEVECSVEELVEEIDSVSLRVLECKPEVSWGGRGWKGYS